MISVIIPVYNESASIGLVLDKIIRQKTDVANTEVEIIVVNDGSRDETKQVLSRYNKEIKLINLAFRSGCGKALKVGFEAASGELIAFLDGDNTYPAESLNDLYKTQTSNDADIVVGSRFINDGLRMQKIRYIGNIFFVLLLNKLYRKKITDATSGMRLFKKDILPKLYPLPDGLDFTVAMTTKALARKLRIVEFPIRYSQRIGRSKLNVLKDGIRFIRSILTITITQKYFSKNIIQ